MLVQNVSFLNELNKGNKIKSNTNYKIFIKKKKPEYHYITILYRSINFYNQAPHLMIHKYTFGLIPLLFCKQK